MSTRRFALRLLLALAVLFGQGGAMLHELGHELAGLEHHEDGAPGSHDVCERCLAFAGLGNTVSSASFTLALAHVQGTALDLTTPSSPESRPTASYLSRAPPSFS